MGWLTELSATIQTGWLGMKSLSVVGKGSYSAHDLHCYKFSSEEDNILRKRILPHASSWQKLSEFVFVLYVALKKRISAKIRAFCLVLSN